MSLPAGKNEESPAAFTQRDSGHDNSFSDTFRYSPTSSSRFAPGDGGVNLDWVDENDLEVVRVTNLN